RRAVGPGLWAAPLHPRQGLRAALAHPVALARAPRAAARPPVAEAPAPKSPPARRRLAVGSQAASRQASPRAGNPEARSRLRVRPPVASRVARSPLARKHLLAAARRRGADRPHVAEAGNRALRSAPSARFSFPRAQYPKRGYSQVAALF